MESSLDPTPEPPYLVSSSTGEPLWVETLCVNLLRSGINKQTPNYFYAKAIEAIETRSRLEKWGNTFEKNYSGFVNAVSYLNSKGNDAFNCYHRAGDRAPTYCKESIAAPWVPTGRVVLTSADNDRTGYLFRINIAIPHMAAFIPDPRGSFAICFSKNTSKG